MKKDKSLLLDKISRGSLYLLIFLLPLFFLPFTSEVLDFNKQALLLFLVLVSFLAWLGKSLLVEKIEIYWHWFYLPVIFLLLVVFLASLFSLYSYGSFWGYPLKSSFSFLTLLGLVLFFFLVVNLLKKKEEFLFASFLILASGLVVALFGILQFFGKFVLPWGFSQTISFNTIGTFNSWGIFLASLLPLAILISLFSKTFLRLFSGLVLIIFLFALFLVNFWVSWLIVLAGTMILLVFGLYNRQEKAFNWILLPATLLAISLFFIIFKVNLGFLPPGPIEISPSFSHNFEITKKVLEKKPIFGTGPGTFVYNFSLYKDVSLNQTAFWQIRFISGASEILENLANSGILWLLGFLGIFFSFVFLGIKKLLIEIKENDFEKMIGISCLACFFALSTSFFFYPANLSLWLLWWFFGAGILIINFKELKEWQIKPKRISSLLIPLIFIISLIGSLAIFVSISERYFAQINHLRGLEALAEGEREKSLNLINWASQINPLVDIYWQDLSQVALNLLNQEIAKAPTDEKPEDKTRKIQFYFNLAINSAKRATDAAPYNVAGWINRGFVYQSAIGLTQGSFDWALKSYEKAKELEPTNPFIPLQIARAYLAKAILSRQLEKEKEVKELIEKAKEELKKSIELKNNYWPAHFQQAVIFDFEGKLNEAISKLEEIKPFNLQDPGFAFQLGSLYWRKEEMRKAREEFERAINLFPNFANARYFLGLAFDKLGEKEKAIEQFEKIASFSKENAEQVAKILENLRKGLPALGKEIEAPPAPEEIPALEEQQP